MNNDFAIHSTITMNDMMFLKQILEEKISGGCKDFDELRYMLDVHDKLVAIETEFEKEKE